MTAPGRTVADELTAAADALRELALAAQDEQLPGDRGRPFCTGYMRAGIRHLVRNVDLDCPRHKEVWGCVTPTRGHGQLLGLMTPKLALDMVSVFESAAVMARFGSAPSGVLALAQDVTAALAQ